MHITLASALHDFHHSDPMLFKRMMIIIKTNAQKKKKKMKKTEENGKTVWQRNIENWNGITCERARYGNSYKLSHSMRAIYKTRLARYGYGYGWEHKRAKVVFVLLLIYEMCATTSAYLRTTTHTLSLSSAHTEQTLLNTSRE